MRKVAVDKESALRERYGGPVFFSGPDYTPEERRSLAGIEQAVADAGYPTYLPYRDGIEARYYELLSRTSPDARVSRGELQVLARAVFALNVYQAVERCSCLVLNLDGRVPDGAGVFKAALVFAVDRPVIIVKRDLRSELYGHDNAMLTGLTRRFRTVGDASGVVEELDAISVRGELKGYRARYQSGLPPHVREACSTGGSLWRMLEGSSPPGLDCEDWPHFIDTLASICAGPGA